MRITRMLVLVAAMVGVPGCYRATVDTGLTPSAMEVEREWAHAWLAGLVPPNAMEVAGGCPNGVARVETELSFLNQVAAAITFGIYTPMTLRAICAA
jgi:hypothetical protein